MRARQRYTRFRVSLLRDDGALLVHADSWFGTRTSTSGSRSTASMLPPGHYLLSVEGYARDGRLEHFAEARLAAG
jgi:hypothetical protein